MSAENKVEKEACIQQYSKVLLYFLVKYIVLVISILFKSIIKCNTLFFSRAPLIQQLLKKIIENCFLKVYSYCAVI